MRPNFLTNPGVWVRTPRTSESPIDAACALSRPSERSWRWADRVIAALLVGVMAAVLFGVL